MTPLRALLMNPPNAVEDTGFHFKNGKPVKAPRQPVRTVFPSLPPPAPIPVAVYPVTSSAHSRIIKAVCKVFDLPVNQLLSARRNIWVAEARQVGMALTVRLTKHSKSQVGVIFGRDHTTVLHALRKMQPHVNDIDAHMPPESIMEWVIALKERLTSPEVVKARKDRHRDAGHCINGHPYNEQNTIIRQDNGSRRCRTCANRRHRLRRRALKARLEA